MVRTLEKVLIALHISTHEPSRMGLGVVLGALAAFVSACWGDLRAFGCFGYASVLGGGNKKPKP